MLIKTISGSNYFFEVNNGSLWFSKGLTEGKVVAIKGLEIGEKLEITFHQFNIYGELENSISIIRSTEIVSIS